MNENNGKDWRCGLSAVAFLFVLIVSVKTGLWMISLLFLLIYIPFGIYAWFRKKPPESSEKHPEPQKAVVSEALAEKKNSPAPQEAASRKKSLTLLGECGLYGTGARIISTDKGFELFVEYYGSNTYEHFGANDFVPDEVIRQNSLQALQDWMNAHPSQTFHEEITVKESDYIEFLRSCGIDVETGSSQIIDEYPMADATPECAEPYWKLLLQIGEAACAADASMVTKIYRDPKTDLYYQTDINGRVLVSLTQEQVKAIQQKHSQGD